MDRLVTSCQKVCTHCLWIRLSSIQRLHLVQDSARIWAQHMRGDFGLPTCNSKSRMALKLPVSFFHTHADLQFVTDKLKQTAVHRLEPTRRPMPPYEARLIVNLNPTALSAISGTICLLIGSDNIGL